MSYICREFNTSNLKTLKTMFQLVIEIVMKIMDFISSLF